MFRLSLALEGGVAASRRPLNMCRPRTRCRRVGGRGVNLVRMVKLTMLPTELGRRLRLLTRCVLRKGSVSSGRGVRGRTT